MGECTHVSKYVTWACMYAYLHVSVCLHIHVKHMSKTYACTLNLRYVCMYIFIHTEPLACMHACTHIPLHR